MPSITLWTRLEPYTRRDDIDAGVQARIHDPLWLLARQWQTGEFQGEDAGSPVQARARLSRLPVGRVQPGRVEPGRTYPGVHVPARFPLEEIVEHEAELVFGPRRDLRLLADAGLVLLRMLEEAGIGPDLRDAIATEPAYRIAAASRDPAKGRDEAADGFLAVMSGRVPDGFELYRAIRRSLTPDGGEPGILERPPVPEAQRATVLAVGAAYVEWFERRHNLRRADATSPFWTSERLEYAFALSVGTGDPESPELVLAAPEYPGGALDWDAFEVAFDVSLSTEPGEARVTRLTRTVLPSPVRYPGMAADRWWQFEDAEVNLGRVEGDPDELMRLLLVEFALQYGNDWFVVPIEASPGAAYVVDSLVVTDAFGQRTLVPGYGELGSGWSMYGISPFHSLLFLPPVLAASMDGEPVEEVLLVRDEPANLVWGVERRAPSLAGGSFDRQAAYRREPAAPPPEEPGEALRYRIATTVPEHWIPFQPRRIDPSRPGIRLVRGAALADSDDGPVLSGPLGRILRPNGADLSLFEEEVPEGGLRLTRHYQYARWLGGESVLWLTRRRAAGRPEESSGLRFDTVDGE